MSAKQINYWQEYCNEHANIHMYVNVYDDKNITFSCKRSQTFHLAGSKAYFWKKVLYDTSRYDYVWLMDEDIRYYDASFSFIHKMMNSTGASILQPNVVPTNHAKFTSYIDPKFSCLVHTTSFVEIQAPLFTSFAWNKFHQRVMSRIDDELLFRSAWLDPFWCSFVEYNLKSYCVFSRSTVVRHLDFKTMNKQNKKYIMNFHRLPNIVSRYIRFPSRKERFATCLL